MNSIFNKIIYLFVVVFFFFLSKNKLFFDLLEVDLKGNNVFFRLEQIRKQ